MTPEPDGERPPGHPGDVLRRANITLIGSAAGGVLAIVNEVLCARYLGVNTYGLYALALIIARVSESVSSLGLPVGALHHVSIWRDRKQPRLLLGTIWASLLPPLLIGLLFAALLWALAPALARDVFDNPRAAPFIRVMALAIPFMGLSEVMGVITRGFGHAGYYVLVRNVVPPVVFMVLLLSITSLRAEPAWVGGAFGAAYLVAALTGMVCLVKVGGRALFRERPQFPFRALYAYSAPVLLNNMLYLVIACAPILMLGVLQTDREVGIFRACMQIVIPFDMFVMAFNAAVGHLYPVLHSNGRRDELAALVERTTRWMSLPALGLLLVITLDRHDLLGLMGPDFVSGGQALLVLAFGHAILCATGSAGFLLVMSGRQVYETLNAAVAAALCVALGLALIGTQGAVGAAFATTMACLLISVLRVVQVRRLMDIRIVGRPLAVILALAGATAVAISVASAYLPVGEGRGIPGLLVRVALVTALFATLYWFFGLDRDDRRAVRGLLRDRLSRPRPY